jgi:transposase
MSHPKIDISQHEVVINLYKTQSLRQIAKIYDVNADTIRRILKQNNITLSRKGGRPSILSDDIKKEISDNYENNIISTVELAKEYSVNSETIRNVLLHNNIKLRDRHDALKFKTSFSFKEMTKEKAFLLGLIYGDGSISKRKCYISITSGDLDLLEKSQKILGEKFKIKRVNNYYRGQIHSVKIAEELYELFKLTNNKSDKLIFPNLYDEFYPSFISGYLATDGCISIVKKTNRITLSFYSCSEHHLHSLNEYLCNKINIEPRNILHKNKSGNQNRFGTKPIYSLTFNGTFAEKACYFIFKYLTNNLWCNRKYIVYKTYIDQKYNSVNNP